MSKFANPRGTADILPDDAPYFEFVSTCAVEVARLYAYRRIETPILGQTSLFARTTGKGTDIVDKEMYTFQDRGGDELSLRPEGTAPVVRAYLEHGMDRQPQPVKLYYLERMYRYDRPQKGRLREHRQFGCEAIGSDDAYVDVEMISLLRTFYQRVGLADVSLRINTIGDQRCRPGYLERLTSYLREHESELAPQDRERLESNPLRVIDSREAQSQPVVAAAPHMVDYLCDECRAHWQQLLHGLELLGIEYQIDHRIVRGLDYYTRTVFEFVPNDHGQQSTVGGGGRYDALSEFMGGPPLAGIGFGVGLERVVLNLRERGVAVPPEPHPQVFVAHAESPEAQDHALLDVTRLRSANIAADMAFGTRSLRAQMRHAAGLQVQCAVIVGDSEVEKGTVTVRNMETGDQVEVPESEIAETVRG